jgi:hypothetical protein
VKAPTPRQGGFRALPLPPRKHIVIAMFRTGNSQNDVERGQEGASWILSPSVPVLIVVNQAGSEGIELMPWPATPVGSAQPQHEEHPSSSHTNGVEGLITQQNGVEGMNNRRDSSRSPQESHEQHQDFDDSANELWSLYGKEAKSHDEARIKTLKDDMDGVLIFVCANFFGSAEVDVTLIPGRLILCCSHRVRRAKDSGFESQSRKPIGILPESIRSDA